MRLFRQFALGLVLLAAPFAHPAAAGAQGSGTIEIGGEIKKTTGVVTALESGDVACYLTLADEHGVEFRELGEFELCEPGAALLGKRVALTYTIGSVMAEECQGDPECKLSRTVALVSAARVLEAAPADRDLAAARAALRAAAQKGEARAQLEYARALAATSREEARAWARRGAEQGLAEAWFWLAQTALPQEERVEFYERAALLGYAEAFPYLFDALLFRAGPSADIAKAKRFADLARRLEGGAETGWTAEDLATIDRCFEAGSAEIPRADRPSAGEIESFGDSGSDCSDWDGSGGNEPDWGRYRKCLLAEPEADNNALAEIYANGWGVARNPKLAIALLCHGAEVPAELIGMVETLVATRGEKRLAEEFRFCDHVTSGMNAGRCAARAEEVAAKKRQADLAALAAGWPAAQKEALDALQKAAEEFFAEHAGSELDMSGTWRAQIAIAEEATLRDALLASLRSFEKGQLPAGTDFTRADRELNEVYAKLMRAKEEDHVTTVSLDGIRATQRKWLPYRDAWGKLGAARYPRLSAQQWMAWVTVERTEQLRQILADW